jgi:putative transposase
MPDKEKYGRGRHGRRSIRLKDYDYSQEGAYFVTICTKNRQCLFGEVVAGTMRLNQSGELIRRIWYELPNRYIDLDLDAFILMPNHLHWIVVLTDQAAVGAGLALPGRGAASGAPYIGGYRSEIQIYICYPAESTIISNGPASVAAQLLRTHHTE